MKKILFTISMLAVALGFTACSSEDDILVNENQNPGKMIITAYTESKASSRTALADDGKGAYDVVWSEGDQFGVKGKSFTFTITNGINTTKGTFEGTGSIGILPLLYGVDLDELQKGNMIWPATQAYKKNNFSNFPMVGTLKDADTQSVEFTNLGGLLRLTVKGNATVKSIVVSANENMAGEFEFTPFDNPKTPKKSSLTVNSITLDCGSGVKLNETDGVDFYIAMPANTYTGVTITLTDTEGKKCVKTFKGTNGLVVERSMITKASFTASDFNYKVGDIVNLDEHEGIVVNINGKLVIVATMNVGATAVSGKGCLGDRLAFAETYTDWSGWRLPTVDELETLCDVDYPTWGSTDAGEPGDGSNSILAWYIDDNDGIDLYLPLNDWDEDADYNQYDKYWTGTPGSGDTYYYFAPELIYDSGEGGFTYYPVTYEDREAYKEEAAKTNTFLVRLFHDLP